jgi:hypothetical protein
MSARLFRISITCTLPARFGALWRIRRGGGIYVYKPVDQCIFELWSTLGVHSRLDQSQFALVPSRVCDSVLFMLFMLLFYCY